MFNFPLTHASPTKIREKLPRLTIKPSISFYTYIPKEAIRTFINKFTTPDKLELRTTTGLGPKSQNEIKFLLYDMYLSGLTE